MSANAVVLVYRVGKGCAQYSFDSAEALTMWASRHPYKNEQLRVMPMANGKFLPERTLPAPQAGSFLRDSLATVA
jgi:hypothetical protein